MVKLVRTSWYVEPNFLLICLSMVGTPLEAGLRVNRCFFVFFWIAHHKTWAYFFRANALSSTCLGSDLCLLKDKADVHLFKESPESREVSSV